VVDVATAQQVADRVLATASSASPAASDRSDPSDPDATAVSDVVSPRVASHARRVVGPTGVGVYVLINTARVTDLNVRRSLNYAIDRGAAVDSIVDTAAVPMTTLLPALLRGPRVFDAYPAGLHGNLDRARRLLAGRFIPDLILCADPDQIPAALVDVLRQSFLGAGFAVTVTPISLAGYRPSTTVCDLVPVVFAPRYPDGDQVLGTLFSTLNYSNLRDPDAVDRLHTLGDAADRLLAASAYVALDERMMRDLAPAIPVVERTAQAVIGPRIATAQTDPVTGTLDLDSVSVA
jgi:peptide/nickel transport system substrate-binding protein